jgi:hypothetical protein
MDILRKIAASKSTKDTNPTASPCPVLQVLRSYLVGQRGFLPRKQSCEHSPAILHLLFPYVLRLWKLQVPSTCLLAPARRNQAPTLTCLLARIRRPHPHPSSSHRAHLTASFVLARPEQPSLWPVAHFYQACHNRYTLVPPREINVHPSHHASTHLGYLPSEERRSGEQRQLPVQMPCL